MTANPSPVPAGTGVVTSAVVARAGVVAPLA
jgi:hypothetical protein